MKKKILFISIPSLAFLIIISLFLNISTEQREREKFEKFISEEYKKIPNLSKEELKQIQKPDRPDIAAMQNYFMTIDPELKRVPTERLKEAFKQTRNLWQKRNLKAGINALEWNEVSSNMGGRTRAVMWDPNDAQGKKVWAGGVTGGLWYNNNITSTNSSWTPVNDFWDNITISCITYDPNDTQTFYVGTGEAQTSVIIYRESSGVGIGIWKTTDGGNTWDLLPSTEDFKYITDIEVRDENGNSIVYAGVVSGEYHGTQHQSQPSDGLYRSTNDGQSWEQVLPNITGQTETYAVADIEIGAGGRIFIGSMRNLNDHGGATILYSDNGTIGSWTIYDDYVSIIQNDPTYYVPGRVIIASAPSDENIVYALIGAGYINGSTGFTYSKGCHIIRSDNKGATWTAKSIPDNDPGWASLAWHAFTAGVDPNDPNSLFIGGLDVYKSTNGGNSWSHLSDWALMYYGGGDDYVHADQHAQIFKNGSSDEVLFGSDGGIFYTSNGSSYDPVFEEKNKNLSTLQFYTCDIYPVAATNYFVGGLQDNGTLLYQGSPLDINDMIDGGDGSYCFFDEDEPLIMITSTYYNNYTIFYNWNYQTSMYENCGVFINPADYDSEMNTLYANAVTFSGGYMNKILRISNIPNYPNSQFVNLNTGLNVYFSHIKVSTYAPVGTSTLFVGSQTGKLFKVENAHATPQVTEIGSNNFPPAYISCVAIGGSEDTILVTFSNYGVPSVWQTYDGGNSWDMKEGNLPDMPVRWAVYHPQNSLQALLATEIGVWSTNDLSENDVVWEPDINGFANVRVDMLQLREADNTVLAATHGRGFFYATYDYNPAIPNADFIADNTSIMQGQGVNFTDLSTGGPSSWEWTFEGGTPATSNEQNPQNIIYNIPGDFSVTLTATNAAGSNTEIKTDYIHVSGVGINENIVNNNKIQIYPNPNNGKFIVSSDVLFVKDVVIKITGINGRLIYSDTKINYSGKYFDKIDISKYPKGIYFIKIINEGKTYSGKIIYNQ
ncbi:MAG: PKD domain-containing protein [Bacteroidales bacterium]|nr:PKD domain-containing protein [Bacteroidales bacterium]